MELTAFEENLCQTLLTQGIEGKDSYCFLTSIFAFVLLVILQILQNNLLDLHLVEICRYKLSFYAKQTYFSLHRAIFSTFLKNRCMNLKLSGGWNQVHNWLKLLTSCGPNLEAVGSNVIFCDFFFRRRCPSIGGLRRRRQ